MTQDASAGRPDGPDAEGSGDAGAAAVEYGLLIALIAIAIISAVTGLASQISSTFAQVGTFL